MTKESKGLRLSTCLDAVGKPAISYSHLVRLDETSNGPTSQRQAEAPLYKDLVDTERGIARAVRVSITQGRLGALAFLVLSLRTGWLRLLTLLHKLNAGDYADVANQLLLQDKTGGKPPEGLTKRRQAKCKLLLS